jgi:hypothetical protein
MQRNEFNKLEEIISFMLDFAFYTRNPHFISNSFNRKLKTILVNRSFNNLFFNSYLLGNYMLDLSKPLLKDRLFYDVFYILFLDYISVFIFDELIEFEISNYQEVVKFLIDMIQRRYFRFISISLKDFFALKNNFDFLL